MSDDTDADVAALLTVPPGEFVAARNALTKTLRAAGRKDDAAAVAALRRPSVVDWALNTVAAESPGLVDSVASAATRLREAQKAVLEDGGGGPDLRQAMAGVRSEAARLRAAAEKVLRRAGRPASDLGALSARVNEVTVSDALIEQLRRSRLGMTEVDVDPDVDDPFAAIAEMAPARRPPRSTTKTKTPARPTPVSVTPEEQRTHREDEAQARAEAAAARRTRERQRAAAAKSVEAATRTLVRLERVAQEADAHLAAAHDAAELAHRAAQSARNDLEAAQAALADLA